MDGLVCMFFWRPRRRGWIEGWICLCVGPMRWSDGGLLMRWGGVSILIESVWWTRGLLLSSNLRIYIYIHILLSSFRIIISISSFLLQVLRIPQSSNHGFTSIIFLQSGCSYFIHRYIHSWISLSSRNTFYMGEAYYYYHTREPFHDPMDRPTIFALHTSPQTETMKPFHKFHRWTTTQSLCHSHLFFNRFASIHWARRWLCLDDGNVRFIQCHVELGLILTSHGIPVLKDWIQMLARSNQWCRFSFFTYYLSPECLISLLLGSSSSGWLYYSLYFGIPIYSFLCSFTVCFFSGDVFSHCIACLFFRSCHDAPAFVMHSAVATSYQMNSSSL